MWILKILFLLNLIALIVGAHLNNYNLRKTCKLGTYGSDYIGDTSVTRDGIPCQRWDSQEPHSHSFRDPKMFPDDSMEDVGNKCRNPDQEPGGPWCYTTDSGVRWAYCDVPKCSAFPECRQSQSGVEYLGHQNQTRMFIPCTPWENLNLLQIHSMGSKLSLQSTEGAYCRNPDPDGRPNGTWCFYGEGPEDWDYCDVPRCKVSSQCRGDQTGTQYSGTASMTEKGRPCQRWDKQYPHQHNFTDAADFPDKTLEDAHNFCRNPDSESGGPWCFTMDNKVEREACDIPLCEDCKVTKEGREYNGILAETISGSPCDRWDAEPANDVSDENLFPDASLEDASNFCRNPDGKNRGPWCYTDKASGAWEYCDIPMCNGTDCDKSLRPRTMRHVLHFGIDGLHPCFVEAPGGGYNIMERIGKQGAWTLTQARTVLESVSGPGWSATTLGMPVESTGITGNSWKPPHRGWSQAITPANGKDYPMPNVFTTLKSQDSNIRTAAFYDWDWWGYILNTGDPGSVDHEVYCHPGSNGGTPACDAYIASNASEYLQEALRSASSTYTLIYMDQVDSAGHSNGWCTADYLAAVDTVDILVGQLLDTLEEMNMQSEVLVVLSSDHGGLGFGHGCWLDNCLKIPLVIRGPSVKKNYQFINEVRNQDIVPTAVWAMGFEPNPWWKGNIMEEIFEGR